MSVPILRKKLVRDTLLLNVASSLSQLLMVVQSFLIMRFLVPGALGVWLAFGIALGYTVYIHLGIDFGLGLRLPYYRGQGNAQKEGECEDSAFFAWTGFALLFAVGMAFYALGQRHANTMLAWGLLVVGLMAPLEQQSYFLSRWQTASRVDFSLVSFIGIARSVVSVLILVPLAYFFGVTGLMLGSLAVSLTVCVIWWAKTEFRFRARVSARAVREILAVGFPVLLVSLAGILIQTVDRLIVASRLGATSLGYYGATSLGGGLLLGVLSQAGNAMAPHIAAELGRAHGDAYSLEKFLVKPTLIISYVAAVGIMVLMFVVPAFIRVLLPRYVPGIPALYGFLPGFFFLAIVLTAGNVLTNVLITRGRQRIRVMVYFQAIAILVEVGSALLFIERGWGITGVAVASTLSYAIYGGCTLSMTTWVVVSDPAQRLPFLGRVAVSFLYCGAATCIAFWVSKQFVVSPIAQSAIGLSVVLLSLVPLTLWLEAKIGLLREIRPILGSVRVRLHNLTMDENTR